MTNYPNDRRMRLEKTKTIILLKNHHDNFNLSIPFSYFVNRTKITISQLVILSLSLVFPQRTDKFRNNINVLYNKYFELFS